MSDDETYFKYSQRTTTLIEQPGEDTGELISQTQKQLIFLKLRASPDEALLIDSQLEKLNSLKPITIPQKDGSLQNYYLLQDSTGGVTEKDSLIEHDTLLNTLEKLKKAANIQGVRDNKIKANAILKYPKKGEKPEVQREAIGLEIARILGFQNVAQSTMVQHKGKPCLFVPFDPIEPLGSCINNAQGSHGYIDKKQHSNIEDFGKYSAYFMLCSDPDFIGKEGQNKGLIQSQHSERKLYIFDQVFMRNTHFALDKSFNLVPTSPLSKMPKAISRHFMGRNKTVINDSSYEEKVAGALHLLSKQNEIKALFQQAASTSSTAELKADAKACKQSFESRIHNIKKLFPVIKKDNKRIPIEQLAAQKNDIPLISKAMVVNQIINDPRKQNKRGFMYRALSFFNPKIQVKEIALDTDTNQVTIQLSKKELPDEKIKLLTAQGFSFDRDNNRLTIQNDNLLKLKEITASPDIHAQQSMKDTMRILREQQLQPQLQRLPDTVSVHNEHDEHQRFANKGI